MGRGSSFKALTVLKDFASDVSHETLDDAMSNASCIRIIHLFQQYRAFFKNHNGSLSAFWISYLDMVEVVLGLLWATREGLAFAPGLNQRHDPMVFRV